MKIAIFGAALLLAVLSAGSVPAQDKIVDFKMSTWMPPQHPATPALQAWIDDINKASGGTIRGKLFPSEQLGKAFDHYDMARDGIVDFSLAVPGYQPGRFPVMDAASLPFIVANGKDGSVAIDAWYRNYAAKEMKDVHFCLTFTHEPGAYHSRKPIRVPQDVRDLKIRPSSGTVGQVNVVLGATNVQSSAPEARDMLERGVANAIAFPWGSLTLFGMEKVVKFHLDAPLYVVPVAWVMNKAKYEALSSNQKKVIDDHCTSEWSKKISGPWADFEINGRAEIAAQKDHQLYTLSPQELAKWREAVAPVEARWSDEAKKAGWNPDHVLFGLKESLTKYNAGL